MDLETIKLLLEKQRKNKARKKGGKIMDEQLTRGRTKSRDASGKSRAIRQDEELSVRGILNQMQEYCDELGVRLNDFWTEKEYGCARNWLAYCKRDRLDPRKILYEVCKFWPRFKRGALINEDGTRILLPDAVSFSKYFAFRRQIGSWIEINRDAPYRHLFTEEKNLDPEEWTKGRFK